MSSTKLLCSRTLSQVHAYVTWTRRFSSICQRQQRQQQQKQQQQHVQTDNWIFVPEQSLRKSPHRQILSKTALGLDSKEFLKQQQLNNSTTRREAEESTLASLNYVKQFQDLNLNKQKNDAQTLTVNSFKLLQNNLSQLQIVQHRFYSMAATPKDVFEGEIDRFRGVTVDGRNTDISVTDFSTKLERSLEYWLANGNRAIWFKIYKEQSDWVPILTKAGFDFHHARTGVVTMYRWLPKNESYNLPHYAHTLLGCGGVVINENNEILVVSDRYALIPNSWKLPGGYVEPQENLVEGVIREVQEETGIDTEFRSVISFRHSHNGNFGCSDMYVVIALKPINTNLKRCEREIARVQWMPIAEYLEHPQVHETNRHFVRTYLDYKARDLVLTRRIDTHRILKREYNLYYVAPSGETMSNQNDKSNEKQTNAETATTTTTT